MDILDGMGVSKLSAKGFSKVNYSFKVDDDAIFFYLLYYFHIITVNLL